MHRPHLPQNRIEKDLIISFFILLFLYSIIHNPIVRPKLNQTNDGNWKIEKMQHPLVFGFAGHNYLVLRSPDNNIVAELHGLATDQVSNTWKYVGSKATDLLKVWEFNGPRNYLAEKEYPGIVVSSGPEVTVENLWKKAEVCKDMINKKIIYYPKYGINLNGETENSNSVAYTLLACMGIDSKHLGLMTPGDGVNLLAQ